MPEQHNLNKLLLNQNLSWTFNVYFTIELTAYNLNMKL